MTKVKKVADIPDTHPASIRDLADIKQYHPFEWGTFQLRVVPVNDNNAPCRGCHFQKQRMTSMVCPGAISCMGHHREDRTSVKFISADLSSLNYDEEMRDIAAMIDKKLR